MSDGTAASTDTAVSIDNNPPPLRVDRLKKFYGHLAAVDGVSFTVKRGSTVGLFGPNGAGKTTILRMLAGIIEPTDGQVFLDGIEWSTTTNVDVRVGVLTHDSMLYDALTARENLRFHAALHGLSNIVERCETVLEMVGLGHRGSHRPNEFSHGLRKRLSLARALLPDPEILLLDEPYAGLDRRSVAALSEILDGFADRTVVLATHDLDRGLARCTRALVIVDGRLEADLMTDSLSSAAFERTYEQTIGLTDGQGPD